MGLVDDVGMVVGERMPSSLGVTVVDDFARDLRGEARVFTGEYSSVQALTTSWLQKASRLGRCGVGRRNFCTFVGELSLDFDGLAGGVI